MPPMKYWEIVADKLSADGWSWGYCSAVTCDGGRWIVDAHREGRRYIVRVRTFSTINTAVYSGRNQSITSRQRWPVRTTGDHTTAEVPDGGLTHSRIEQNVIGFPVAVDVGGASQHPAQR